ncbi:hypothetical protein [Xanthomonas phaseoli]|uniref:hypothetical protein n=1 Tax=Xanthomonas phaseoli TaxID=1985254 RepID=UPI00111BA7FF|nr:hypothetical protein [Xanthomonas phaseoli]MBO9790321.1 hypothetical protein [Xanthomonas phaseoli pv. dieffenbachiae]MBO9832108.1 hypothetical protein [Xanthomonas phaseoli pv. dieffenbachiae]MBO9836236.1 hypothetical protein [Xanthomonas phaseoli pv. dieffenbachiae]MBO9841754.1 hypothetical protein [Xanthomonas phaseoli pv. dieffenbachiae]MBO9855029.1 hypothetical protein [Xanthomonas phaseoli pv. dieffenbachiae]
MILEIESGISLDDVSLLLDKLKNSYQRKDGVIFGNFDRSNSRFIFRCNDTPEPIAAEGLDLQWLVGITGSFHCRADSLNETREDIESFLRLLNDINSCNFVLSFQYEDVYILRNDAQMQILKEW